MVKASAADRARRTIALLGQLAPHSRTPLATLARQVGATPAELAEDIVALSMCGVWPYDPYELFPVDIEGRDVVVYGEMPAIRGPVRLSEGEAAALAAALQAAGFSAEDPLTARVLDSASTGFDAADLESTLRSAFQTHDRAVYESLADAVTSRAVLTIEHAKPGEETPTRREIEPTALFTERGAWYVTAWCRSSEAWRTFRVDRIRSASATGERFEPRAGSETPDGAFSVEGLPVATLRFAPGERFDVREWPGGRVTAQDEDGSLTVAVPYGGTAWLARRVAARLGAVVAVEPTEIREAVRAVAADAARCAR